MNSGTSGLHGAQRPRVSSVPSYVTSAGDEAIEFCETFGLLLDPWQQHVLRESLGERIDGKWSAFEVGLIVPRQNGKGGVLEARELAGLFLFDEHLILHSAHEFKTSLEAFRRVVHHIEGSDMLRKRVKRVSVAAGQEGVELTTGARLRFVARSKGSGRGFSGDVVIMDEAYNLSSEGMAAMLPTLSARPNPQVWYTSSAGMETSDQLASVRKRGTEGSSRRLAYFEWSADPSAPLDDREAWAQANPALGIRISAEFVESERDAMDDLGFARERLGHWFEADSETVIDMDLWSTLVDAGSELVDPVAFAVDAAPDRSSAAIAVCGKREDGLFHVEIVEHRNGTAWVPDRVLDLTKRWDPLAVALDPAGPAGSLIPALQELEVEPYLIGSREAAQSCGAFFDAVVEQGNVRHLDQPHLNTALAGAKQRPLGDAWAWHRKNSMTDISPLVAATLAHHAFVIHSQGDDSPPNIW